MFPGILLLAIDAAVATEQLVVRTPYSNTRGLYTRQPDEYRGYSTWQCHATGLHLFWSQRGWRIGDTPGSSAYHQAKEGREKHPADATGWDEGVTILRADGVKPDLTVAPDQLLGISKFSNFQGLYRRGDVHDFFPTYQNEDSRLWLWHDLFGDAWLLSASVGSGTYYWRIASGAASPLHVALDGSDEFTRFEGVPSARADCAADEQLIVKTPFTNTRGLYTRQSDDFRGFPVWHCAACLPNALFLFRCTSPGAYWMVSTEVGSGAGFHNATDSAAHPADATGWDEGVTILRADGVKPDTTTVSSVVIVTSRYSNLPGGYVRQDDRDFYPSFRKDDEDGTLWLWHDLYNDSWVISDTTSPNTFLWMTPSNEVSPLDILCDESRCGDAVERFESWDWREEDSKYEEPLFIDVSFPPAMSSIGNVENITRVDAPLVWLRALNLNRDQDDVLWKAIDPTDIQQGELGDCWLIAAISVVAKFPHLIHRLFGQEKSEVSSTGRYDLQLYDVREGKHGGWVDVVIDDHIPCREHNKYERHAVTWFGRSTRDDEIWPLILEKAVAKFVGSYGMLQGGTASFAWQALTACEPSVFRRDGETTQWKILENDLPRQRDKLQSPSDRTKLALVSSGSLLSGNELFARLQRDDQEGDILAASISPDSVDAKRAEANGLVTEHEFSILAVTEAKTLTGRGIKLIRLRNPWANARQWNGSWSANSSLWFDYPEVEQHVEEYIGGQRNRQPNGIFWMSWSDFRRLFDEIEACQIDSKAKEEQWDKEEL